MWASVELLLVHRNTWNHMNVCWIVVLNRTSSVKQQYCNLFACKQISLFSGYGCFWYREISEHFIFQPSKTLSLLTIGTWVQIRFSQLIRSSIFNKILLLTTVTSEVIRFSQLIISSIFDKTFFADYRNFRADQILSAHYIFNIW